MAFTSVGTEIKSPSEDNPYCIWIQGQIEHMVSPLYPNKANKPGYGQLYIVDSAEETIHLLSHINEHTK
jgi:hypothetical protein